MKRINRKHLTPALFLTAFFLLAFGITAFANVTKEEALDIAAKVVPAGCTVTELSYDEEDHEWECEFLTKNKVAEYEVNVHEATGRITKIEMEKRHDKGGCHSCISKKRAKKAVTKKFPDAVVTKTKRCKDDGRYIVRVWFYGNGYTGDAEVNASTGKINEWTKYFPL